jgi:predicted transcriptional regulator of viral defense system
MNELALARKLEGGRLAVHTTQQLAVTLGLGPASARVRLNRLVERGVLARPMRGRYCLASADQLAVATGIYLPSYVSMLAAFEFHGTTTQSARAIDVLNPVHSGRMDLRLESGRFEVRFIKVQGQLMYGYFRVFRNGMAASVAEKEKAIIDTLLLPGHAPLDEAMACIRAGIDIPKAIGYAKRTGRQAVIKRLGYMLSAAGSLPDHSKFGRLSRTYVPMDPSLPRRGTFDRDWRVIVNRVIE